MDWRTALPPAAGIVALLAAALLAACGPGTGEGLDEQGNPAGTTTALCPSNTLDPTWECIQRFVFNAECTHCHSGAGASAGLSLDADNSQGIVNRASSQAALDLVEPGVPDDSYLIWKVVGQGPAAEAIGGIRMPWDGPPYLDAPTIQTMRDWITAGAPLP